MPVAIAFRLVFGTVWSVLWHYVGPFKTLSGGLLRSFVCVCVCLVSAWTSWQTLQVTLMAGLPVQDGGTWRSDTGSYITYLPWIFFGPVRVLAKAWLGFSHGSRPSVKTCPSRWPRWCHGPLFTVSIGPGLDSACALEAACWTGTVYLCA